MSSIRDIALAKAIGGVGEAELTAKLADKADAILDTASGAIASFPDGVAVPAKDITIGIEPVQAGSGDPSPENVRPISGWTGANVVVSPTTEAHDGTTYPISWETEAGTVYGGTLDVTTGLLTVTKTRVHLGDLTWSYASDYSYFSSNDLTYEGKFVSGGNVYLLCSCYKSAAKVNTASSAMADAPDDTIVARANSGFASLRFQRLYIKDASYTSATALKTALNGQYCIYELNTPVTYQLTPVEIEMLLGGNKVWADTGDSTVTYRADTKLYIQKINTPTDDDMIADAQIASGKYFIIGGNLYLSTTTILAGNPIKPGTNCTLTNLAAALNAINA